MTIYKCKGCNQSFPTDRGLSSHFQHKNLCKSIHYAIACQGEEDLHIPIQSSIKNIKKKVSSTVKTSKLSIDDSLINDITCINNNQCNDNEECNIDVEASNIKNVMESGDAANDNEFVMEFDAENQNEYVCNFINDNDHNSLSFHNDDCVENNLLKLILEIGAPNYAFKKILNLAKDAYSTGYQFNPRSTT